MENNRKRLDYAKGFAEVWEIVKETVESTIRKHRVGMMLFLDDLPLQIGAYHQIGTNNLIVNRALLEIVEAVIRSKPSVNSFIYVILLHEYLHALGYLDESEVRPLVYNISLKSFGEDHAATKFAKAGPWIILKNIPLTEIDTRKRAMEVVKDFEWLAQRRYIV